MKQTIEDILALLRGTWRYRWPAMGMIWAIVLIGWPLVYLKSEPQYTARAQIYVDAESVLRPLLKGLALEINPSDQLGLMARQLMSRPNLEQVVEQTGLGRQGETPQPPGVVLEGLANSISLKAERTSSAAGYTNFYVISYTNSDPELAKKVVQSLIDAFTDNTLTEIRQDAERAREFIDQKIADYKERLTASERRLREFKREYVDVLPQRGESYFELLRSARAARDDVALEIRQTESLRDAVQAQLARTPVREPAVLANGRPVLNPLESRLVALQTNLDELLLKYTEAHPDVIETRASIAALEGQLLRSGDSAPTMPNPEYLQLELKRKEVEGQLAGLRTKLDAYGLRVVKLQQQIETLPVVEDELRRLTREYETNKDNYTDLVTRRQSMAMSESVDLNSEDLKFRVVEPPNVPVDSVLDSVWKKQLLLLTGVLAAAVAGGVALAFLLSQIRPAVYDQRVLIALTGLPVYGVVSEVPTASVRFRRRLGRTAFLASGAMILGAYAVTLMVQFSTTYSAGLPWVDRVLGLWVGTE